MNFPIQRKNAVADNANPDATAAAAEKLLSSQKFVQVFKEELVPSLESGDKEKIRAALANTTKYAKEAQDVLLLLQLKLQLGDVKGALDPKNIMNPGKLVKRN